MTVLLTDLEYPIPRLPGTTQTLPMVIEQIDQSLGEHRNAAPSILPHLNVPSDIIVFYKTDAERDELSAWSSQVYRFDPAAGAMRRIV